MQKTNDNDNVNKLIKTIVLSIENNNNNNKKMKRWNGLKKSINKTKYIMDITFTKTYSVIIPL